MRLEEEGHKVWESADLPDAAFDPGEVCYVSSTGRVWVSTGIRWLPVLEGLAASGSGDEWEAS